jgi:hypothetical protein
MFDHMSFPPESAAQRALRLERRARLQKPTLADVAALASSAVLRKQAEQSDTQPPSFQGYSDFSTSTSTRRPSVASSLGINI